MSDMLSESINDRSRVSPTRREHLLLFRLGDRCYGLPLPRIDSLSPAGPIRPIRPATAGVLGISEWRGRILTVLDLPRLLDAPESASPLSLIHLAQPWEQTSLYLAGPVRLEACDVAEDLESDPDGFARFEFEGEWVRLLQPEFLMERVHALRDA